MSEKTGSVVDEIRIIHGANNERTRVVVDRKVEGEVMNEPREYIPSRYRIASLVWWANESENIFTEVLIGELFAALIIQEVTEDQRF